MRKIEEKSLFHTDYRYKDRETKAKFVYEKYKPILKGKVLDVGADQCYLREYLGNNAKYVGVGLHSDKLDLEIDLEKQSLPYEDNSFDVVLCCDVLEHIEDIHDVFDELCRVSKKYVIISLPNAHAGFLMYLEKGNYYENQHMKFYGLPLEKPDDRHKWFFSTEEAERFILYKAKKNNMEIVQLDIEGGGVPKIGIVEKLIFKFLFKGYFNLISNRNLYIGTLWTVLRKKV